MQPMILIALKPENSAFGDEFFGPSQCLSRQGQEPAIALGNNSDFGLGGSVFTKDIARGKQMCRRGIVRIICGTPLIPDQGFDQ